VQAHPMTPNVIASATREAACPPSLVHSTDSCNGSAAFLPRAGAGYHDRYVKRFLNGAQEGWWQQSRKRGRGRSPDQELAGAFVVEAVRAQERVLDMTQGWSVGALGTLTGQAGVAGLKQVRQSSGRMGGSAR
jgi:hypothetical protein